MIINMNGGGGSNTASCTLSVSAPASVTVTVTNGTKTYTKTSDSSGNAVFKGLTTGNWTLKIENGTQTSTKTVTVNADYTATIAFFAATINITYPSGSTCTATNGSTTLTAPNTSGSWSCVVPNSGAWTIACTDGNDSDTKTVSITSDGQNVSITLAYNAVPEFTYTGDYSIEDDEGNTITESKDNWNIKLLTSGTLTLASSVSTDIFVVGGGGSGDLAGAGGSDWEETQWAGSGGGGGGYTTTATSVSLLSSTGYIVTIGAGGSVGQLVRQSTAGGASSIVVGSNTYSADGGAPGRGANGGNGGSGGGAGTYGALKGGDGGTDGYNGKVAYTTYGTPTAGTGQGTTTRAFGETSGTLYASGGAGGGGYTPRNGLSQYPGTDNGNGANTGNGGKGGCATASYGAATDGGSGIIIIRNHRAS